MIYYNDDQLTIVMEYTWLKMFFVQFLTLNRMKWFFFWNEVVWIPVPSLYTASD